MNEPQPPEENPFASPQEASPPMMQANVRPLSIAAVIGVSLLSLVAGLIAFCCSCFPVGLMVYNINDLEGPGPDGMIAYLPWIVGLLVGGGAIYLVWRLMTRALRRPR